MRRSFALQLLSCSAVFLFLPAASAWAARAAGIDVSHFQGTITAANWVSVKNSGISFAWSKADEGVTDAFNDSTFLNNMNNGGAAGIYMGAYHYAHPESNTAAADAAHFIAVAGPYLTNGHLRPMLDIEGSAFDLSTADLSTWINTFCTYVTDRYGASADPLIYMSASRTASDVNASVTGHGLDVASYGTNPVNPPIPTGGVSSGVWPTWSFWQYGSQGRVPGIGGGTANVDMDVLNGDASVLQSYIIGGTTPPTLFEQFDVNGTTAGSGVANNGSYTWEAAKFSSTAAGTDATTWNEGNFLRLAAGTDAAASNYTITANSNHTFAGMYLQANGGGTVTINGPGVLSIADGDQGFYVSASTQNLKIAASLAGTGRLVWQGAGGSLFLLGNNTYSGGTLLNAGSGVNFNNDHSFGTGRITWGVAQQVLADDVATAPVTLANPVTTFAAGTLIYVGPAVAPVTFTGAWTLASGNSTLSVGNASHTSSKMTISGSIGGSGGALIKAGTGTLVLGGANTYTGGTTLNVGALTVSGASARLGTGNVTVLATTATTTVLSIESGVTNAINDAATLAIAGGATAGVADQSYVNLGDGVNEFVHALALAGVTQANGTYGSSLSGAMHQLNEFFSGTGMITVGLSGIAGDFNNDYIVDARDYVVWRQNAGQPAGSLPNDTAGGVIGNDQYDLWRSHFGMTAGSGSGSSLAGQAAVPEPGAAILALFGSAGITVLRGRRRLARQ